MAVDTEGRDKSGEGSAAASEDGETPAERAERIRKTAEERKKHHGPIGKKSARKLPPKKR
jgi:hypothetical protein